MESPLSRSRLVLTSILLVGGFSAHSASAAPLALRPGVRVVQAVREAIKSAANPEEAKAAVAKLPQVLGATYRDQEVRGETWWWVKFGRTISVRDFATGMGWIRPFALSGDTHQTGWHVVLWRADMVDFYRRPILRHATPQVGRWAVRAWLVRRPRGPLPEISAGGSPAYDLDRHDGEIGGLEIVPWKPEYDQMWLVEQSKRRAREHRILGAVAQPATYRGRCPVDVTFVGTLYDLTGPKVQVRWERSDGVWTDIEQVTIRAAHQPVRTTWRVGAPHQHLEVWQKLRIWPLNLASEPAKVILDCE